MENRNRSEEVLLSWLTDGQETSTMPSLYNEKGDIEGEYEVFNIFSESEWEPDEFVKILLPNLESTYLK